jgi:N-acyl homoserine lactone hydrolase
MEKYGIKMYVLSLGSLTCDTNALVAFKTRATALDPEPKLKFEPFPVWGLYIETPDAKIVFDTGLREDCLTGGELETCKINTPISFKEGEELVHQLDLCGVSPDDIDYVVMSHLHHDHAGRIGIFKNAKVIVQRKEMIQALLTTHTVAEKSVYLKADLEVKADWHLIDGDLELVPGIRLITVPGHTDGLQCLLVDLDENGPVLITSDACYTSLNWGPPERPAGALHDSRAYFQSLAKLKKIQKETGAKVIFGHDVEQFSTLKKAPQFYD